MTNRQKYCDEAFKAYGVQIGDTKTFLSYYEQYKELNGKKVKVVGLIGADSDWDMEGLPAYKCICDGKEYEVLPEEITICEGEKSNYISIAKKANIELSSLTIIDDEKLDFMKKYWDSNGNFIN